MLKAMPWKNSRSSSILALLQFHRHKRIAKTGIFMKSLDQKLKTIALGKYTPKQFIVADAKDPDMGSGVPATGPVDLAKPDGPYQTVQRFNDDVCDVVLQGVADIMLASVSTIETVQATIKKSKVTAAIRANEATDVWGMRGSSYKHQMSRPFRTANLERIRKFADLGLYSVTFNNDLAHDVASLEAYTAFRNEAVKVKFRHFLEVFNPNAPQGLSKEQIPAFVNDSILRCLSGQARIEKPVFLKIPFNGRRWLEELVDHDSSLVVGVLGGSGGTARDTFELLHQAEKSGAKVALFGRKIKLAESPLDLLALFRPVIERNVSPADAVKQYHAALAKKKIRPVRALEDDLAITEAVLDGARS
jgi:hypothetical protein